MYNYYSYYSYYYQIDAKNDARIVGLLISGGVQGTYLAIRRLFTVCS